MGADKVRAALEALGPDVDALREAGRVRRPEPRCYEFFVPALPRAVLSSNGDSREPRNRWTKAHAKQEIGVAALQASLAEYPAPQPIEGRVDVLLVFHVRPSRKADCPRCLDRALHDSDFNGECLCYRPTDPSNIGGEVTKSIIDYGVSGGPAPKTRIPRLIQDDHRRFVRYVLHGVEIVDTLVEEGVSVRVQELITD